MAKVSDQTCPGALASVLGLSIHFGGIVALDSVSFDIGENEIVGLIGPNGAGKTTLFNCLSRLYEPSRGDILFEGRSIMSLRRHEIARIGIGRTFQNVALFDSMSVLDNVKVGGHCRGRAGALACAVAMGSVAEEDAALTARARELIDFMDVGAYALQTAGNLPFPIRKRVELARALASRPKLLLLDEPAAGLNHEEVEALKQQIRDVRDIQNVSILLVEHHMSLVMAVSDKVVAIDFGRKIAQGTPKEVQENSEVIRAYLGRG